MRRRLSPKENHVGVLESLSPRPQVLQGSGATLPIVPNATPGAPSCTLPAPPVVLGTSPCERGGGSPRARERDGGRGGGSPRAPAASSAGTPPRCCSATPSPHHFSPLILQIRLTKQGVTTDVGQYRAPTSGTGLESKRRRHRSLLAARPCSHTAGRTFPLLGPGAEVTCRPFAPPAWITFPRGAPGCSPFGLPRPPPTSLCSKIKP